MRSVVSFALFILLISKTFCQESFLNDSVAILGSENKNFFAEIFPNERMNNLSYRLIAYDMHKGRIVNSIDGFVTSRISISRPLKLVSVLGVEVEKTSDGNIQKKSNGHDGLIILTSSLKVFLSIDSVMTYSWNPTGEKVAYIKGFRKQEKTMFVPTGVFILDVKSKKSEKIADSGYDIQWAGFDSYIYIQDWSGVLRYNTSTKYLQKVGNKGIYFSADGKYYLCPGYEGKGFELFDAQSNQQVVLNSINTGDANFFQWLGGSQLVAGDMFLQKKIIDVKTGTVRKTFNGKVFAFNPHTSEIWFHMDKKVFKELNQSKIDKIKLDH